jgi:hypothetical protein
MHSDDEPLVFPMTPLVGEVVPAPAPKPAWKSKTLIFNLAAFALHAIVAAATGGQLPAEYAVLAPLIQAAGNFLLRFVTSEPISVLSPVSK